jgi:hypothetical protein
VQLKKKGGFCVHKECWHIQSHGAVYAGSQYAEHSDVVHSVLGWVILGIAVLCGLY